MKMSAFELSLQRGEDLGNLEEENGRLAFQAEPEL